MALTPVPGLNPSPLDTTERAALAAHEATIEHGLQTFVDVGTALAAIRDERLYRASHDTFEAYAWQRWRLKQSQTYRLMDAAEVVGNLQSSPIGELPANEAQARPLTALPPEQQPAAWQRAVETAPETGITARHVERVVRSMTVHEADAYLAPEDAEPSPDEAAARLMERVGVFDAPAVKEAALRANYSEVRSFVARRWLALDPVRCADVLDVDDRVLTRLFLMDLTAWIEAHQAALGSTLRRIGGAD